MLQAIIDILECTYLWEHLIIRDNMSKLTFNVLRIENINGRGVNDGISIPIQVISEFLLEYVDDDSNRAYTHWCHLEEFQKMSARISSYS